MRLLAFLCVWLGCIILGWIIPYWIDPRHDVEWAAAAGLGMVLGAVVFGPVLGYWAAKIVSRPKDR